MATVSSLLVLLEEPEKRVQSHALRKLLDVVDQHWSEVAESVAEIEQLCEDETFADRQLAAAVASRCFYHLEEYDEALRLALLAGDHFDVSSSSEYSSAMASKCVEEYIRVRTGNSDDTIDPRLETIVERMFEVCYARGEFQQAIGIALEAHRLDKVKQTVQISNDARGLALYCYTMCRDTIRERSFRQEVLQTLVALGKSEQSGVYVYPRLICECLHDLDDPEGVAAVVVDLLKAGGESELVALQIAFDFVQLDDPIFIQKLLGALRSTHGGDAPAADDTTANEGAADDEVIAQADPESSEGDDETKKLLTGVYKILTGGVLADAHLNFLANHHHVDDIWLKQLKTSVDSGRANSVTHNALVVGHAYMVAGTTYDSFLRSNINWLGKASHWSKFTASACMGIVHRGNTKNAMRLLKPYLPKPEGGVSSSPFSEAGSLLGLGILHSCPGAAAEDVSSATEFIKSALANAATQESESAREALQSGATLGLGLLSIASNDSLTVSSLRDILYQDNAVAGEAVGIAIGLIHLGRGATFDDTADDMLRYAHDTQHEKIIRGLSLGIALMMLGQEQAADVMAEQLCAEQDPILRYGGVHTIAMAYAGTGDHSATRRLLHIAVSDVSDDVRRAAVIGLGFVMLGNAEKLPPLLALLGASFNPHVRYGVCLALGICCVGRGTQVVGAALDLLEPLVDDKVDYVRQGALQATAMLFMQSTHGENVMVRQADGSYKAEKNSCRDARVDAFRKKVSGIALESKISSMTRMGALMASGLIDAGGCNMHIHLIDERSGKVVPRAVVGMMLWTQHWFWYPMATMISLAFGPGMVLGVNKNFKVPVDFGIVCESNEHKHAYSEKRKKAKAEIKERVKTAVLSISGKKRGAKGSTKDDSEEKAVKDGDGEDANEAESSTPTSDGNASATSFRVPNGHRVTPAMSTLAHLEDGAQYVPVRGARAVLLQGVLVVGEEAANGDTDEEMVEGELAASFRAIGITPSTYEDEDEEPDAPEPFVWRAPISKESADDTMED